MSILTELTQEQQREQFLLNESKNALTFLKVERVAGYLTRAGVQLTPEMIAFYGFIPLKDVQQAITWMTRGTKKVQLPFELGAQAQPQSKLDQVKSGLLWIESRGRLKRDGRPLPPEDTAVTGVQRVMQLTGLGRVEILDLINQHRDEIVKEFPDFRDSWVGDTKEIIQRNAKNQHPETRVKLLRQAMLEISKGVIGTVTAEQLSRWQGGKLGLSVRQIDNLLSNHPDLRDLDKYRAYGRNTKRPTDADRAIAYQRSLTK